ncbi:unnamed protein product [Cuscuta campestris]|uniref:Reverse transcriptase domain-containing protein n=1 Tax=Cuscuta campestris TaxID=132261 RepID=A0A484MXS5_9ASTE|nr:unnamed protein product [Cuscuta campestris]
MELIGVYIGRESEKKPWESLGEKVQEAEETYQAAPIDEHLMQIKAVDAQYSHQLHLEELFWKQKAHVQWVVDGNRNSKYFHALVKAIRRKLYIHKIKGSDGNWIEDHKQIFTQAIDFFHKLFSEEQRGEIDYSPLTHITPLVFETDNTQLVATPTMDEVKQAVFDLSPNSAAGLDGFTSLFYQKCWDIISLDVYDMVCAFFTSDYMTKNIAH